MINLYVMNVSPFEDRSLFLKGLSFIDKERQDKVNNLKREDVKRLSLGAGLILLYGLNHFCSQRMEILKGEEKASELQRKHGEACEPLAERKVLPCEIDPKDLMDGWDPSAMVNVFRYSYGPHGKPYVDGPEPIFFSLSHSGEYVLLAVSDREIGADIQQRKDADYEPIARHFMTQDEYEFWEKQEALQRSKLFFQIWAGKEAYLKLTGEGMTAGFQTVCFHPQRRTMVDLRAEDREVETWWYEIAQYQIAVCQLR